MLDSHQVQNSEALYRRKKFFRFSVQNQNFRIGFTGPRSIWNYIKVTSCDQKEVYKFSKDLDFIFGRKLEKSQLGEFLKTLTVFFAFIFWRIYSKIFFLEIRPFQLSNLNYETVPVLTLF